MGRRSPMVPWWRAWIARRAVTAQYDVDITNRTGATRRCLIRSPKLMCTFFRGQTVRCCPELIRACWSITVLTAGDKTSSITVRSGPNFFVRTCYELSLPHFLHSSVSQTFYRFVVPYRTVFGPMGFGPKTVFGPKWVLGQWAHDGGLFFG